MSLLRHALALASFYLWAHRLRAGVMILGLAVVLFLPAFTFGVTDLLDERLLSRAKASPILITPRGDRVEQTLACLYFQGGSEATLAAEALDGLAGGGYGLLVPLYVRHSAGGAPVVGTDRAYLSARGLTVAEGRPFALLGEMVAGHRLAEAFELEVGDNIRSDQTNLYNIAGAYPFLLEVTGILAPSGGPDDDAFFVDLNTAWALDGDLHGHDAPTEADALPGTEGDDNIEASAALFMFDRFDARRRASFHLHGEAGRLPLSAILAFPDGQRAHDLLLGDLAVDDELVAIRPVEVVETVLGVVFKVRDALGAYFFLVALSTGALFALVISLGLRLRAAELTLMVRLGSSRGAVAAMVAAEVGILVILAVAVASGATTAALALVRGWL